MKYLVTTLLIGMLCFSVFAADKTIYSWIDNKGIMHFTDKTPHPMNVPNIEVQKIAVKIETPAASASQDEENPKSLDYTDWAYQELKPSCRWIAKRITLLEELIEQHSSVYDEIFSREMKQRQQDWSKQDCGKR